MWMFTEMTGVGLQASFQQESRAIVITRISERYPAASASDHTSSVEVLSGDILLKPRRESHENGFSSPAPSFNWRLCRQTMDHLSPPLCRRIPEGPRNVRFADVGKPGAFGTAQGAVPGMGDLTPKTSPV